MRQENRDTMIGPVPRRCERGRRCSALCACIIAVILTGACAPSPGRTCSVMEGMGSRATVVLGHPDFAGEVSLTPTQARLVRTIEERPLTEQERTAFSLDPILHPEMPKEVERATGSAIDMALRDILSTEQYRRFREIMLQVYGPEMVIVYGGIPSELGLSPEQVSAMTRIVQGYEGRRQPLVRALGRYVMAGYTELDSVRGAEEEGAKARTLVRTISALARELDHELLDAMTEEQRRRWQGLQGRSIRWRWPERAISAYGIDWSDRGGHP